MTYPIAYGAQLLSRISRKFNMGNGSTWPGHIALKIKPTIVKDILGKSHTEIILVVGTNGKTTTATFLTTILAQNNKKVIQNTSGANLLNGIASTILLKTNPNGRLSADYAIFEVDENNLPIVLEHITPKAIIALDLFRDQLDRYGELDSIAKKWNTSFRSLSKETTLVLNADDPLIAYLAKDVSAKVVYFGLPENTSAQKHLEHASDSIYCPNCGHKLDYSMIFFSHLGIWHCPSCGVSRPMPTLLVVNSPLPGTYNIYNTFAAALTAKELGVAEKVIISALKKVEPAFGRQEKLTFKGKNIQLFLSKNPTSMNESLKTIVGLKAKNILLVLNDRIPDGRDVSWIWDIDIENFSQTFSSITVSGDRTWDMALRLAYSMQFPISNFQFSNNNKNAKYEILNTKYFVESNLNLAIKQSLNLIKPEETLFILPTYSAMLDVRKILTGKKIL